MRPRRLVLCAAFALVSCFVLIQMWMVRQFNSTESSSISSSASTSSTPTTSQPTSDSAFDSFSPSILNGNSNFAFDSKHSHVIQRNFPVNGDLTRSIISCPSYCPRNHIPDQSPLSPLIVAALKVRIYPHDPARLTAHELLQWIQFHRMAGIDRILLCDSFSIDQPHESVLPHLWPLVRSGIVEYYNFSQFAPPLFADPLIAQSHCYNTVIRATGDAAWATTVDMDEYIVSGNGDDRPGFIRRQLATLGSDVATLVLQNYVMHGLFNTSEELLIKRVRTRSREPDKLLTKYFTRPSKTRSYDVHHPMLHSGSASVDASVLHFLHIWGSRSFGWLATTVPPRIESTLVKSDQLRPMGDRLEQCARLCNRDEFHWLPKPGPPFVSFQNNIEIQ